MVLALLSRQRAFRVREADMAEWLVSLPCDSYVNSNVLYIPSGVRGFAAVDAQLAQLAFSLHERRPTEE